MKGITPFVWYDDGAEQAVALYSSVFPDHEVLDESRHEDGSLFLTTIRLQGQEITLLNGGPHPPHNHSFSFSVSVEGQDEVDAVTAGLISGGGEQSMCGWVVDRWGLSWQVVPTLLVELMGDPDPVRAGRVRDAMLQMRKIDLAALQAAYDA